MVQVDLLPEYLLGYLTEIDIALPKPFADYLGPVFLPINVIHLN